MEETEKAWVAVHKSSSVVVRVFVGITAQDQAVQFIDEMRDPEAFSTYSVEVYKEAS